MTNPVLIWAEVRYHSFAGRQGVNLIFFSKCACKETTTTGKNPVYHVYGSNL